MPLKTLVKVGNISNLSDARYCAGMGVEMLGFTVIEGRENFIPSKSYQEIRGWVSGPSVVAEVYGLHAETNITAIRNDYSPDFLELSVDDLPNLSDKTLPLILLTTEDSLTKNLIQLNSIKERIAFLILEESNNTWSFIEKTAAIFPVLVALESSLNLPGVLEKTNLKGIVLNGSQELKPGLKDYDQLAEVLEQLDTD